MNLKNEINRAAPVVDRLNDAIRENPLAAGLIGAGLAWMLFGSRGIGAAAGLAKDAAVGTVSAAGSVGAATAGGLRSAGKRLPPRQGAQLRPSPKGLHHSYPISRHLTPRSCRIPPRMRLPRLGMD